MIPSHGYEAEFDATFNILSRTQKATLTATL